jgi:hypothetical protein
MAWGAWHCPAERLYNKEATFLAEREFAMRAILGAIALSLVTAFLPPVASAQLTLPRRSTTERQLDETNQTINRQLHIQQQNQNFQMQLDQLRSRQYQFELQNSPGLRSSPGCPVGAGC